MKTMKKAISVLLLVCMVFALCSAGAYAVDAKQMEFDNVPSNMEVGETVSEIKVSGQDKAKTYTWEDLTSSDNDVIQVVDNNTIKAIKAGKSTITSECWLPGEGITGYDNATEKYIATMEITVLDPLTVSIEASSDDYTLTAHLMRGSFISDSEIGSVSWTVGEGNVKAAYQQNNVFKIAPSSSEAINGTVTANITPKNSNTQINGSYKVDIPAAAVSVTGITVSPATTNVAPSGTVQMSAAVTPVNATNKGVNWSITSGKASVDPNGLVTVKADADVGSTITVTATAQDGSNVTGTAQITVSSVPVESVSLNKSATTIAAGSNETLTATVKPDNATGKTVKWTSSDSTVATVDSNGKVTAVKEGTATITAAAGGKYATCTVTVTKPATVRIDVSSNLANNTITARGSSMTLYAKVYKDNSLIANSAVTWSVTDSTSSNGLINLTNCNYINNAWTAVVTGNFNGDYTITAACTIDGVTYSEDLKVKVAYAPSIVAGNYSVWNGRDALSFLVNDHISNWNCNVWIDGIMVNSSYYTCIGSSDGEIWLTLSPSLLNMVNQNNPKNSTHTITVGDSRAAAATGYFRTWGTASSFNGVKTGDDANLGLWAALLAVSAVGAGAAVVICKRRKANRG